MATSRLPRPDRPDSAMTVIFWITVPCIVAFGLWIPGLLHDVDIVLGVLPLLIMAYVIYAAVRASFAQKREDLNEIGNAHLLVKHCRRTLDMVDRAMRDMEGLERIIPQLDRLYERLDAFLVHYRRYLDQGTADIIWEAETSITHQITSWEQSPRVFVMQMRDALDEIERMILDVDDPILRHKRNRV